MIINTELHDLAYSIKLFRSNIKFSENIELIRKIIKAINNEANAYQPNNIRKSLAEIEELADERWQFVRVENIYTLPCEIIKTPNINKFLSAILSDLLKQLENKNYEQAYDLADVAHAIPEILAEYNGKLTNSYWKNCIEPYRKKWGCNFLEEFQKDFTIKYKFLEIIYQKTKYCLK